MISKTRSIRLVEGIIILQLSYSVVGLVTPIKHHLSKSGTLFFFFTERVSTRAIPCPFFLFFPPSFFQPPFYLEGMKEVSSWWWEWNLPPIWTWNFSISIKERFLSLSHCLLSGRERGILRKFVLVLGEFFLVLEWIWASISLHHLPHFFFLLYSLFLFEKNK